MNELKIKEMIKNKYDDVTEEDIEDMYQTLQENNLIPKNEEELKEIFNKMDEIGRIHTIDDADDEIIEKE